MIVDVPESAQGCSKQIQNLLDINFPGERKMDWSGVQDQIVRPKFVEFRQPSGWLGSSYRYMSFVSVFK